MKVIAVSGSPRKRWNTHQLLEHALQGAADQGAETELVFLYDLQFRGCMSCFGCKRKEPRRERCIWKDELQPVLEKIYTCDALLLGTPVYLGDVTSGTRAFVERLAYPFTPYTPEPDVAPLPAKAAVFYTMGLAEQGAGQRGYPAVFQQLEYYLSYAFSGCESQASYEAYQFEDYEKYRATKFDPEARKRHRDEVFLPRDCRGAYEIGARLARAE